jgi:polysaccharide pyruvyl transferase CsaB
MTNYVISGYIGFDNFGDEAIAQVLTSYLKTNKTNKITVLSSNPQKTAKLYNVNSEHFLEFFKPILKSDVLISGGGSLLQDITSLKSLIYYLTVIVTALVLNKKVIIFAQGFTPFRTKLGKIFTKFVLKYCHKIYVRDSKSQEILKDLNIKSELISDPVFKIQVPDINKQEGIGIQLRDFNTLTDDFLDNLVEIVSEKFPKHIIKLISLQDNTDLPILQKFADKLTQKDIKSEIYKNLNIENATKILSELEYLIGMRFHANLISAKARVKVLGINYDVKIVNLSKQIGFPIIELDEKQFKTKFEELFNLNVENYNIPTFNFPEI